MNLKERFIDFLKSNPSNYFFVHDCGFCGYKCAFYSNGELLFYDSGCNCVTAHLRRHATPRPWDDLDFYLNPDHGHISKIEKLVGISG